MQSSDPNEIQLEEMNRKNSNWSIIPWQVYTEPVAVMA